MEENKLTLITSDGKSFKVDLLVAHQSQTIKNIAEDMIDLNNSEDLSPVPLPNVHSNLMPKLLQFMEHYVDNPVSDDKYVICNGVVINVELTDWDKVWMPDTKTIAEYLMAANFLDCRDMLLVLQKGIANMIPGKSPAELRRLFKAPDDLTDEDKKENEKKFGFLNN